MKGLPQDKAAVMYGTKKGSGDSLHRDLGKFAASLPDVISLSSASHCYRRKRYIRQLLAMGE